MSKFRISENLAALQNFGVIEKNGFRISNQKLIKFDQFKTEYIFAVDQCYHFENLVMCFDIFNDRIDIIKTHITIYGKKTQTFHTIFQQLIFNRYGFCISSSLNSICIIKEFKITSLTQETKGGKTAQYMINSFILPAPDLSPYFFRKHHENFALVCLMSP